MPDPDWSMLIWTVKKRVGVLDRVCLGLRPLHVEVISCILGLTVQLSSLEYFMWFVYNILPIIFYLLIYANGYKHKTSVIFSCCRVVVVLEKLGGEPHRPPPPPSENTLNKYMLFSS